MNYDKNIYEIEMNIGTSGFQSLSLFAMSKCAVGLSMWLYVYSGSKSTKLTEFEILYSVSDQIYIP